MKESVQVPSLSNSSDNFIIRLYNSLLSGTCNTEMMRLFYASKALKDNDKRYAFNVVSFVERHRLEVLHSRLS